MGRVHEIDSGYFDPPDEEPIPLDCYYDVAPEEEEEQSICPLCGDDCSAANPPVIFCPMKQKSP